MSNWQQYFIIRNGFFLPSQFFAEYNLCYSSYCTNLLRFFSLLLPSSLFLLPSLSVKIILTKKTNSKVKSLKGRGQKLLPKRIIFFPFENMNMQLFSHFLEKTAIAFCHLNARLHKYSSILKNCYECAIISTQCKNKTKNAGTIMMTHLWFWKGDFLNVGSFHYTWVS